MSLSEIIEKTSLVAYDGCHKIYLMDTIHKKWFQDYEVVDGDTDHRMESVETWWDKSCPLRFIEWITSDSTNNLVFTPIICQFD
jgi:hypothetical protein